MKKTRIKKYVQAIREYTEEHKDPEKAISGLKFIEALLNHKPGGNWYDYPIPPIWLGAWRSRPVVET